MTDLKQLLDLVATAPRTDTDPERDLARARTAARARTSKRLRAGGAGVLLVAAVAIGVGQATSGSPAPRDLSAEGSTQAVRLVSETLSADPYTFDLTPRGWSVQDANAFRVTITPDDGSTSDEPDDFRGKLVILFDQNPPDGRQVAHDGRDFWIRDGDSGYTTVATATRADEPPGVVRVQYPDDAGWSDETMLAFLGSVHVGADALPGHG